MRAFFFISTQRQRCNTRVQIIRRDPGEERSKSTADGPAGGPRCRVSLHHSKSNSKIRDDYEKDGGSDTEAAQ